MRTVHAPGTYKAYRFFEQGWLILFKDEQGNLRLIDDAVVHTHKQAAYRKAAQLNEKGKFMSDKQVVEWVTRRGHFIEEVETRYLENGERTHSRDAVHKWDEQGKKELLERQLRGETPTEPWEREIEDPHMTKRTSSVVEERVKNR